MRKIISDWLYDKAVEHSSAEARNLIRAIDADEDATDIADAALEFKARLVSFKEMTVDEMAQQEAAEEENERRLQPR